MRLSRAVEAGVHRAVNTAGEDAVAVSEAFTRGRGLDAAVMAFGADGTEVFKMLVRMMKLAPDTHRMGRIVNVGGARIDHAFAAALGNIDVRSSARTGPGYHDEAWEHGKDYPPVFVPWTTTRNIEEVLRFTEEGGLKIEPLITHRVPIDQAPEACEQLIQTPNEALGVVILP
jgi:threonine dehydrogenase-like Zn-dependent dehydrogenase